MTVIDHGKYHKSSENGNIDVCQKIPLVTLRKKTFCQHCHVTIRLPRYLD